MEIKTSFGGRKFSDLKGELAQLQADIRARPGDSKLRVYLFQLLVVLGEWQRALGQLQTSAQLSPEAEPMARTYREALRCELVRAEVFAGRRTPQVLGEPPGWIGLLVEALQKIAGGEVAAAASLRAAAFDEAPACAGTLDETPFEWIADADPRLGPVCEAIVNGQYYWIPFAHLREVRLEPPTDLRDLVWASAHVTFANGGESVALMPVRYPGSESSDADDIRLARRTEWRDLGHDTWLGTGQRVWTTDVEEKALLDVRHLSMAPA